MEEYSEKEEQTFRKELFRRLDVQDVELKEIKVQVLKTNGRVNKHDWYFTALWWAAGIIGGGVVAFLVYITPIVFKFMQNVKDLSAKVALLESKNNNI